jgi:His/Glu/Gln/Arg/opine family amino acid ABC transporter permease subunit
MKFDPALALHSLPAMLHGLLVTIALAALVVALGLAISIPLAVARNSRRPVLAWPAAAYVIFFRGTPAMILLFLVYFGFGQVFGARDGLLGALFSSWVSDLAAIPEKSGVSNLYADVGTSFAISAGLFTYQVF